MHTRYCIVQVPKRGYGLGNELIPWARGLLAAQVTGAHFLPPAFGLNRRGYWRHFGTPRYDWLRNRTLLRVLPHIEFAEADWRAHGGGDALPALRSFAAEHRLLERRAYVLTTRGLWGGLRHIAAARARMRAILQASRFAARNLMRLDARLDPALITIGMHLRFGDFRPADGVTDYRGVWNKSLPTDWYLNVARNLHRELGDQAQFLVVSDGSAVQLKPLLEAVPCITTADIADSDCSDLLALADADLLVCSISSFSMWAAFLSRSPYLWYMPNLHAHPGGLGSIWGDEYADSPAAGNDASMPRGLPVDRPGNVPRALIDLLRRRHAFLRAERDLVQGGRVPLSWDHASAD